MIGGLYERKSRESFTQRNKEYEGHKGIFVLHKVTKVAKRTKKSLVFFVFSVSVV